jgi:hypothetical protein
MPVQADVASLEVMFLWDLIHCVISRIYLLWLCPLNDVRFVRFLGLSSVKGRLILES